jgi:hypothetical protein
MKLLKTGLIDFDQSRIIYKAGELTVTELKVVVITSFDANMQA